VDEASCAADTHAQVTASDNPNTNLLVVLILADLLFSANAFLLRMNLVRKGPTQLRENCEAIWLELI
jgi:hypothetical protein